MKKLIIIFICSVTICSDKTNAQPGFKISEGIYRIPYEDGTEVSVGGDHLLHSPEGRIDMNGTGGSDYEIVAAAEGWIYAIEDDYSANIDCDSTTPDWMKTNNYVWIEHPNGEFTKYSHMRQNSTTDDADLGVGDYVCAGQFLGYEDDVGCAGGDHLHFEVARPIDGSGVLTFTTIGGFINGNTENLIPVICGISQNVFVGSVSYTAEDCVYSSCLPGLINLSADYGNDEFDVDIAGTSVTISVGAVVNFYNGSNGIYQAGDYVILREGFTAYAGSQFIARIRSCNNPGYDVGCVPSGKLADADIQNIETEDVLKVYPNPVSGKGIISWHLQYTTAHITINIYSKHGILINRHPVQETENHFTFDASGLSAGTYKCVLMSEGKLIDSETIVVIK